MYLSSIFLISQSKHMLVVFKRTVSIRILHQVVCLGSLGLNFEYDGGPIIENGGPIFLYKLRILEGRTSFVKAVKQLSQNIKSFSYLNHLYQ